MNTLVLVAMAWVAASFVFAGFWLAVFKVSEWFAARREEREFHPLRDRYRL